MLAFLEKRKNPRVAFTLIAIKYHLLNDNPCLVCEKSSNYQEDLLHYEQHYQNIQQHIHQYLSIDPTNITTSYLSPSFVCHYCNSYIRLAKYIPNGLSKRFSKMQHRHAPTIDKFRKYDYIKKTKKNNKYIIINFANKKVKYKTFLSDTDVYKLLVDLGIIVKEHFGDYSSHIPKIKRSYEKGCPIPDWCREINLLPI